MTVKSHLILAFPAIMLLVSIDDDIRRNFIGLFLFLNGCVLPDIDVFWCEKDYKSKSLIFSHRGITHHVLFAMGIVVYGLINKDSNLEFLGGGMLHHVMLDSFSKLGVPYWGYNDRIALNLIKHGSITEYIVVWGILIGSFIIAYDILSRMNP